MDRFKQYLQYQKEVAFVEDWWSRQAPQVWPEAKINDAV